MIPRDFFQRDPLTCARELIGCELVWHECAGIIVETEAYSAVNDEASHTFMRRAARDFVARHPPGTAYVYMNYGVHWLLNALVKGGTEDGFVLIRALEPTRGLELMQKRRLARAKTAAVFSIQALCSGPGKLAQALGISGSDHGRDLCAGEKGGIGFRLRGKGEPPADIQTHVRIGISKAAHLPWRFLLRGSPFISVHPKVAAPRRPLSS